MRKTMKITTLCMAFAFTAGMALSAVGCASTEELINDGKTINIKLNSAGYGTDYIYAMQEKFEETYAEEGYKLNIFTPKASFTGEQMLQDIATGTGADVYIGAGITQSLLANSAYANTIADITDSVANQKPIGFDGEEDGDKTIAQILSENDYGYTCLQNTDGSYYAIPWTMGIRGLAVNTSVLAEYDLEIPKTSKEFFNCFEVLMAQGVKNNNYPITHISSSNNYPVSFTSGWIAQYEGLDWYEQFFTFQKKDGTKLSKDEAVEMFNADGIEIMLENMYRALDPNCGSPGSKTQGVEKAQANLMNGICAFMMNGDWLLQETYYNSSDEQRANISFVNVPVISELGVKLFGAGTSYNKSEEDCEKILRAIIDEVDANKEIADIKTAVSAKGWDIQETDIQTVAAARGYTYTETVQSGIYVNASSEVKDLAALFLRMCASVEGGQLIASKTLSSNPFALSYESNRYEFVNQSRAITNNRYFKGLRPEASGYRASIHPNFINTLPHTGLYVNLKIIEEDVTIYKAENDGGYTKTGELAAYATAAQAMQKANYDDAKNNYNDKW